LKKQFADRDVSRSKFTDQASSYFSNACIFSLFCYTLPACMIELAQEVRKKISSLTFGAIVTAFEGQYKGADYRELHNQINRLEEAYVLNGYTREIVAGLVELQEKTQDYPFIVSVIGYQMGQIPILQELIKRQK